MSAPPQPRPDDRLLFIEEVAEITRIPVNTLRYRRSLGQPPYGFKLGKRIVYWRSEVYAWINSRRPRPQA